MGEYLRARRRLLGELADSKSDEGARDLPVKVSGGPLVPVRPGELARPKQFGDQRHTLAKLARDLCAMHPEHRPRVLLLTSAGIGEGVTTVSRGLARALADNGARRVLVVDTDLRSQRLERNADSRGLAQVLDEGANYEAALQGEGGVRVLLSGGPVATDPGELLESRAAGELLERLRQDYDFVLLDVPPVNDYPDSSILGRRADATILVVEAGRTTRFAAQEAIERLSASGSTFAGVILNRHDDPLPDWVRQAL